MPLCRSRPLWSGRGGSFPFLRHHDLSMFPAERAWYITEERRRTWRGGEVRREWIQAATSAQRVQVCRDEEALFADYRREKAQAKRRMQMELNGQDGVRQKVPRRTPEVSSSTERQKRRIELSPALVALLKGTGVPATMTREQIIHRVWEHICEYEVHNRQYIWCSEALQRVLQVEKVLCTLMDVRGRLDPFLSESATAKADQKLGTETS